MAKDQNYAYHPISNNILDHEILPYCGPLNPVRRVEDLITLAYRCLDEIETPDLVEQLIDGISRLCNDRSAGFEQKMAPLLTRMGAEAKPGSNGIQGNSPTRNALKELISAWISGDSGLFFSGAIEKFTHSFTGQGDNPPFIIHLARIAKRVRAAVAAPLISMPTHIGGWIDPMIWIDRLIQAETEGRHFDPYDICLSLLRLAPDNRPQALVRAQLLPGDTGRLARFALGGDSGPLFSDRKDYPQWITAARAREPEADWRDYFAMLKLRNDVPEGLAPAYFVWKAGSIGDDSSHPFLDIEMGDGISPSPSIPQNEKEGSAPLLPRRDIIVESQLLPTANLARLVESYDPAPIFWERAWLYMIWPQQIENVIFSAMRHFVGPSETNGPAPAPNRHMLADLYALMQKNRPWGEGAHLLLAIALASEFGDARRASIDLFIRAIKNRLLDPALFVRILSSLSAAGWQKHKYWGEAMLDVARFSSLHAMVIGQCVEGWLVQSNAIRNYAHLPLEILTHVRVETGLPLQPATLQRLRLLKGRTKAAKLANYLIKSQPSPDEQKETEIF